MRTLMIVTRPPQHALAEAQDPFMHLLDTGEPPAPRLQEAPARPGPHNRVNGSNRLLDILKTANDRASQQGDASCILSNAACTVCSYMHLLLLWEGKTCAWSGAVNNSVCYRWPSVTSILAFLCPMLAAMSQCSWHQDAAMMNQVLLGQLK